MKLIETEIRRPKEDDPRYTEFVGTRSATEVFEELKQRLDGMGLLPDEYFELAPEWENGKLLPRNADIFVTTDYGECEGIYLDAYLKWHENGKPVTRSFFTGKTLEETGSALDRMFLISSAITKAFHGYGRQQDDGLVLCLNAEEKKELIEALMEKRERMLAQTDSVEKLLRRSTGSITAYMDMVGARPMHLDDYDKAVLAIHDGELEMFKELLPGVHERMDELLVEVASRAGTVGRKMTMCMLAEEGKYSENVYLESSTHAVETGDVERVKFLMDQYRDHVKAPDDSYYGEVIDYACGKDKAMGHELIAYSPNDWIAAANPSLHVRMSCGGELRMTELLIKKGLQPGLESSVVLQNYTCSHDRYWMAVHLLENGMEVRQNDYLSLDICMRNGAIDAAMLLLDKGVDFDRYREWAGKGRHAPVDEQTYSEVLSHWNELHPQEQTAVPEETPAKGLTLGGLSQ